MARRAEKDAFITIVSGVPRSGTSMMMRMLAAGGMSVLTDNIRKADEDNPHGYYELERAKQLGKDASWLEEATGKVFKAVYMLLYDLPDAYSYKVIFMKRRLEEVLASQSLMLKRQQKQEGTFDDALLIQAFQQHLVKLDLWLRSQPNFDVLYLSYNDVLKDPKRALVNVDSFLGLGLDQDAMVEVVDTSLYRQRC